MAHNTAGVLVAVAVVLSAMATVGATVARPSQPDVLFLCSGMCRGPATYTNLPSGQELEWFRLSRTVSPFLSKTGGRIRYLSNLALSLSDSDPAAILLTFLLSTPSVGVVATFSDLRLLHLVPSLLQQAAEQLALSGARSVSEKYMLVILDDLLSQSAVRSAVHHIDPRNPSFVRRVVEPLVEARNAVTTLAAAPMPDVVGYAAGAAAATACREVLRRRRLLSPTSTAVCHVAVFLQAESHSVQITRSGINQGISQSLGEQECLLSGAYLSDSEWTSDAVALTMLRRMELWKENNPVDVIVADTVTSAFAADVEAYSAARDAASGGGAPSAVSFPVLVVSVFGNDTSHNKVASQVKGGLLLVNANFTDATAQLFSWLFDSQTSLVSQCEANGRCLASWPTGSTDSADCVAWILRPFSDRMATAVTPNGALDTSTNPPQSIALNPAYQLSNVQAEMLGIVARAVSDIVTGALDTKFDYRLMRVRLDNTTKKAEDAGRSRATHEDPSAYAELTTSVTGVTPFGASRTLYMLNPIVVQSPVEPGVVLLLTVDSAACERNTSIFTSCLYSGDVAVLRYDRTSNSLDRMLVYAAASATKSPPRWLPYNCVALSQANRSLFVFGGQVSNGSFLNRMERAVVAPGMQLTFEMVVGSSTSRTMPTGRGQASLTDSRNGTLYLYGGKTTGDVIMDDLWAFDPGTLTWTVVYLGATFADPAISYGTPPSSGRYLHSATYANVTDRVGNMTETDWLVISGGRFTTSFGDTVVYMLTHRRWVPIAQLQQSSSDVPCIQVVGSRLTLTLYSPTGLHMMVFNLIDRSWGGIVLSNATVIGGSCAMVEAFTQATHGLPLAAYSNGQTALIAGSGIVGDPESNPLAIQEYLLRDCRSVWHDNYYTSSSGLECAKCPSGTYAKVPTILSCTPCPVNSHLTSLPSAWPIRFCYVPDTTQATTAFSIVVFLQVVAVPLLVVLSNTIVRSRAWAEDEFAVTELSEAIVDMLLERVAFLERMENPSSIQRALALCVSHIKTYRRLIPCGVLNLVDWMSWRVRERAARTLARSQRRMVALVDSRRQQRVGSDGGRPGVLSPGDLSLGLGARDGDDDLWSTASNSSASDESSDVSDAYESDDGEDASSSSSSSPEHSLSTSGQSRDATAARSSSNMLRAQPHMLDAPSLVHEEHPLSDAGEAGAALSRALSRANSSSSRQWVSRTARGALSAGEGSRSVHDDAASSGGASDVGHDANAAPLLVGQTVTSRILRALVPHLKRKRVTIMWVRLEGLTEWRASSIVSRQAHRLHPFTVANGDDHRHSSVQRSQSTPRGAVASNIASSPSAKHLTDAAFFRKYNQIADLLLQVVQEHHGVPDIFFGDSLVASWNAVTPCSTSELQALTVAHTISSSPVIRSTNLRATAAINTGIAHVGILGGDGCKRLSILSPVIAETRALAAQCRKLDVSVLVEWTAKIQNDLSDKFVFRIIGAGRFLRRAPKSQREQFPLESSTAASPVTGRPVSELQESIPSHLRWETSLIAEMLGPATLSQWQYELKGHREHIDSYNTIVRTVFTGDLEGARRIPLPRSMPKWYQVELQQICETGSLQTVDVVPVD